MSETTKFTSDDARQLFSPNDILNKILQLEINEQLCFQQVGETYGYGVTIIKAFHEKIMVFLDSEAGAGEPLVLPADYTSPESDLVEDYLDSLLKEPEDKDLPLYFLISETEMDEGLYPPFKKDEQTGKAVPDLIPLKQVCPVCEGCTTKSDENYQSKSSIAFVGGKLPVLTTLHEDWAGRDPDTTCITINFCPFCGRKLTTQNV